MIFSFCDNFGPGAALRVTRWCLALELAMDKQAACVASGPREWRLMIKQMS